MRMKNARAASFTHFVGAQYASLQTTVAVDQAGML